MKALILDCNPSEIDEDYNQYLSEVAKLLIKKGRVDIQKGNVSSLPYSDNHFNLITTIEAHYYWPDLGHDMKEILLKIPNHQTSGLSILSDIIDCHITRILIKYYCIFSLFYLDS